MSGRVAWHDLAQTDLTQHVRYLASKSPKAARRFVRAVETACNKLARLPHLGSPCDFHHPAAAGLRWWIVRGFPNHLIVYQPQDAGISIVRVLHAGSDWQALFEP